MDVPDSESCFCNTQAPTTSNKITNGARTRSAPQERRTGVVSVAPTAAGVGSSGSRAPQLWQNFVPFGFLAPHAGQNMIVAPRQLIGWILASAARLAYSPKRLPVGYAGGLPIAAGSGGVEAVVI